MCEANIFVIKDGVEKEIMKDVLALEDRGDHLLLADLMGNEKELRATIKHIDFGHHKVVLEEN